VPVAGALTGGVEGVVTGLLLKVVGGGLVVVAWLVTTAGGVPLLELEHAVRARPIASKPARYLGRKVMRRW
jgi:hypothetical protein